MKGSLFRAIVKKYARFLIAMLLVSSLGCGLMAGMANGFLSLKTTLNDYIKDMKYPDAVVETKVMTRDILGDLSDIPGVEAVDARLIGNLVLVGKDDVYYSMQAMTYSEEEFQDTYYWEKSDKEAEYPVLLEYRFAKLNDIHAGDPVEIRVEDRVWDCMVEAVISRPEMLASHRLGDIEIFSTDIGYVYVPSILLAKVANPDYDAALSQWEENEDELINQKTEAEEEYKKILREIGEAEKQLNEKKKELDEQILAAESKKEELLKYKEEITKKTGELKEKEAQLPEMKKQLDKAEEEIERSEKEVSAGWKEIRKKKKELDSAKASLENSRNEIIAQQGQLGEKEEELKQKKEELQKAEKEIKNNLQELDEKEKLLKSTREELQKQLDLLKELREVVLALKALLESMGEYALVPDEAKALYDWLSSAIDRLDSMLSYLGRIVSLLEKLRDIMVIIDGEISRLEEKGLDIAEMMAKRQETVDFLDSIGIPEEKLDEAITDLRAFIGKLQNSRKELIRLMDETADPEKYETFRKNLIQECKNAVETLISEYKVPSDLFDEITGKLEAAIKEIEGGFSQMEDAFTQIADGKELLLKKQKEIEGGFSQISDGEKQLEDAKAAAKKGLKEIDEALSSVDSGYNEINRNTKKIRDGESKIRKGRKEYDDNYRQYLEARKLLSKTKDELLQSAGELESGIRKIDDGLKEGKQKIRDAEEEIKQSRDEAREKWDDFLNKSEEAKAQLDQAREELGDWNGYDEYCNQFLLRFKSDADHSFALAEVEKTLGKENVESSYTYEDSRVKHTVDVNVDPLEIMAFYVPMVFFAVALIVEFLFMSFLIRQCHREIGILRALGFTSNSVVSLFCSINLLVSLGAILLGLIIDFGITRFTCDTFQEYFYLFFFNHVVHWGRFWVSTALTVIVGQIATILSAGYISHIKPVEAMSRPAPPAVFSEKSRLLSNVSLPPFLKYCLSSLLRNKKRLVFSLICLSSSVALIFTSISFDFSKNRILIEQFEDRIHYDCEILLDSKPDEEFWKRISSSGLIQDAEETCYYSRDIEGDGVTLTRTIRAVDPDSRLLAIYDEKGRKISPSDEGIILEKHSSEPLNVSESGSVLVAGREMKVSGIAYENINRYQYISAEDVDTLGSADMYSIICNVKKENEIPLMKFLSKEETYIYAAFTTRVYDGIVGGYKAFGVCAMVVLAFAVMIGLVIVINTICTNLHEQKKDLCILRTLGFQYSGISFRLMSQAAVYYIFASAIGVPSGFFVTKLLLKKMEIDDRSYPIVNDHRVYIYTLLLVLAYVLFSHFVSMRTIKTWNLVETVKDKE